MSPTTAQRPVAIRPSPAKCLVTSSKPIVTFGISSSSSPGPLTPPRTSIKRRHEDSSPESVKCKRRITFTSNCIIAQPPAAVARRNARERNRVKQVNNGFATLRQHIPGAAKAKKISKVETLKQAVDYIRALQSLLDENELGSQTNHTGSHMQIPSGPPSAFEYTTAVTQINGGHLSDTKLPQYHSYYYSENVSPVCYPLTVPSHSPTCSSDGATSSPSPSYISDNSFQMGTVPITVCPEDSNILLTDTFTGNFGMQYLEPLEEEDFIETCIETWESK